MKWHLKLGVVFFLYTTVFFVFAEVIVDTSLNPFKNTSDETVLKLDIAESIIDGSWNRYGFKIKLIRNNQESLLTINAQNYAELSANEKEKLIEALYSYYGLNSTVQSYKVVVDAEKNKLHQEPIIEMLGIDSKSLEGKVPAENLLSEYAKRWAYKQSEKYGPNCWHTSMASIFQGWKIPRRMPPDEFSCMVKTYFKKILEPSQWGDLISLTYKGEEVHGFTYLGVDSKDPKKQIVFTKNGRAISYYLFMDLETVKNVIYPGNEIAYYRAYKKGIDPKEDKTAPCQFDHNTQEKRGIDPVLLAFIRKNPTENLVIGK